MHCDVVVVGAGVSGLACAAALSRHGVNVTVFEARDDIGGRLASYRPADGGPVLELGAQVIHGDRNPLRDLAAAGLPGIASPRSHPVPRDPIARVLIGGRILPFGALARGGMPPWVIEQKLAADHGSVGCRRDGRTHGNGGLGTRADGPAAGRECQEHRDDGRAGGTGGRVRESSRDSWGREGWGPEGRESSRDGQAGGQGRTDRDDGWDGGTVSGWLDAQGVGGVHRVAAAEWFRQNWAAEPGELSADGVAAAWHGGQAGEGEYSFEGGFESLARALGDSLAAAGSTVRVGRVVDAVEWAPGRAEVVAGGARVGARAVVVTVPPVVVARGRPVITPMPAQKMAAARALPAGDGLCAVVVLARPADESAVVFDADGRAGFVRATAGRPEVLVVAKAGAAAAVRAAGVAGLTGVVSRAFPWAAGLEMTSYRIADWGRDPWSGGAFSYPGPGARRAAGAWAAPVQSTVFFAGEATTAGVAPASVPGALSSGLDMARKVMEALT